MKQDSSWSSEGQNPVETGTTLKLSETATTENSQWEPVPVNLPQRTVMPRGRAILLAVFLLIVVLNATSKGSAQFIGAEGWAFVLGGPASKGNPNLLKNVANQLHTKLAPGATARAMPHFTPQEYIDALVQNMTLDQKLGQMMIVQFVGPQYGLDISTMISQYNVGAALLFGVNNNIQDRAQLKSLIGQMHSNSTPIPLMVAIDQEGGTVDRLINLDGPRPSATEIGATNDPNKAMQEGIQDAQDLSSYGFNLNLAPVVDVNNVYNPQMYLRTFGNNAASVIKMAGAYLQGLQRNGKVLGTLKHFPGLGDVSEDPHNSVPHLYRSKSDLEAIDWAPYRVLIQQGDVHAVMVTHEIVTAIDDSKPSSLSYKVVTGILRDDLGFQGVIITDSLTMEGITAYYSEAQAAAVAIEAGSDLLMGASTPNDVASMINGIKQAINAGEISQQRIDDSVRRILMLKYQMGLLHIPAI
ncbi:MAG TPA: glycoside hydrolase family 3 N-terminal domain-containing protein [Ktedonobacteraceae bacterium]|nr:glycoside hydrolase family 3 N-terminal domain-containing protein [Ktedonobacteraceae bacterium]